MSEISKAKWRDALPVKKLENGKKRMINIGKKMILIGMQDDHYFATEALCRHMRWPLAWGAKVEDDCIRCPLHQTRRQSPSCVAYQPIAVIVLDKSQNGSLAPIPKPLA